MISPLRSKDSKLTRAWTKVRLDPRQYAYFNSGVRINVVAAGRRSFKTEGACRRLVRRAIRRQKFEDTRYFACAPTQQQSKDIFWDRILRLVPAWALATPMAPHVSISQSELVIKLWHGGVLQVAGLDKPQRIEGGRGGFWDGGVVDEFADCKPGVIDAHIRPMMMRGGWLDITGVPEGKANHFYLEYERAKKDLQSVTHHWKTSEVLHLYLGREAAEAELRHAKANLPPHLYRQEYDAEFVSFEGKAYYCFDSSLNVCPLGERLKYNPILPLVLCLDFNSSPGVAVILQEQASPQWLKRRYGESCPARVTAVIDEVYIPRNSNTKKVVKMFAEKYRSHKGEVHLYGDPAGGAKVSSQTEGTDWDIAKAVLKQFFGKHVRDYVAKSHPPVRVRMNSLNGRLSTADEIVHLILDNKNCPMTIRDFDQVESNEAGDIVKEKGSPLTHLTDALGYYVAERHPLLYSEDAVYTQSI